MSFIPIDGQFIDTLESSGIIDAYEYVLRKLIQDNLPRNQVYEKCARYLLEYQKLLLENNIRAKNAQSLYKLTNLEQETKKEVKKAKEIIPTFPITLRTRLLLEQEENRPPQKIFETNIDELIKNKLNLLSKSKFDEEERENRKGYGSYAAFVEKENEKIRMYNFKINTKFSSFKFTPMEEIEKADYPIETINNNNYTEGKSDHKESTISNNNEHEFSSNTKGEKFIMDSRKNTNASKRSESESVSSKSITPSQASKIKKISKEMTNDLMKK